MKTKRGTTLIEALVFLFIFSLITVTFYSTWSLAMQYITLSKNRLVASALATEKMEVVRNLAFEDVARTSDDPVGNLVENEDIVRSGGTYHVFTQIVNRDDSFDGTLVLGTDADFVDYKDVKIVVSWGTAGQSVSASSRFVPAGIEQSAAGRGILVVNVTSDKDGGALVSGSQVDVYNLDNPAYHQVGFTDSVGRFMLVGISDGIKNYRLVVSKGGYETVETLPPFPTSSYNPTHEHASVVELSINTANIYQNELAELTIRTKDSLSVDVSTIDFYLKGGRTLGTDVTDPTIKIYNTDAHEATNGNGEKSYGDVSPGPYRFLLEEANTVLIGMDRAAEHPTAPDDAYWEFTVVPDETATVTVKVSPDTTTSVLFKAQKDADGKPISGASVHLTSTLPFDDTVAADAIGYAFFPDDATPFVAGTYDYTVSAAGYTDVTGQVMVSNGALEIETVSMTAS